MYSGLIFCNTLRWHGGFFFLRNDFEVELEEIMEHSSNPKNLQALADHLQVIGFHNYI